MPKPDLHLPDGQNWSCHGSGLCCRAFTRIPVDAASRERIENLPMDRLPQAATRLACAREALVDDPGGKGLPSLRIDPVRGCVFLAEGNRCEIHAVLGEGVKPRTCGDFPYFFRETPGGVFVGVSFVCPSARENRGAPVAAQGLQLEGNFAVSANRVTVDGPVRVTRRLAVDWEDYLVLERSLLDILSLPGAPLGRRLIACCVWVGFLDAFWQSVHGPFPPGAEENRFEPGELARFAEAARRTGYADVMRVAAKPAGSARLRRMFLGMVSSLGNALWHRSGRVAVIGGILRQYFRHAVGIGSVRLEPLARRVPHRVLARTRLPADGPAAELLERYVRQCVFRKDLVDRFPVWKALHLLVLNLALVRWYAAAVAWDRGHPDEPEAGDFSEAVRHVEQVYGCHSRLFQFFGEKPQMDDMVESFIIRKNYPFVMLG